MNLTLVERELIARLLRAEAERMRAQFAGGHRIAGMDDRALFDLAHRVEWGET